MHRHRLLSLVALATMLILSCQIITTTPTASPTTYSPTPTNPPTKIPTPLPPVPVEPGAANPNEPVFITGNIPYTSPFFVNSISQPFVLLEDQAGFVQRDLEFTFALKGQVIGPVEIHDDQSLTYSLALPAIPQGTLLDVDNNGRQDTGVQIFAIAYWSNTWGDPFLEERDGTGWSTAYASTITDPENKNEITGGILLVWAPDDDQGFPTGFGEDGLVFTNDDPTAPIPRGYNLVNLNEEPFHVYKEAQANISLNEGVAAVNDFSEMSYTDAFLALLDNTSREYPFTAEKDVDWQALKDQFSTRVEDANSSEDFYRALRDFSYSIPDGHINLSLNANVFYEERGGGFGLVIAELSDGRIIVTSVISGTTGEQAGIQAGAEIITWEDQPVAQAIEQVIPYFGPYSTEHAKRLEQVNFLTRVPPGTRVGITYKNPGQTQAEEITLEATVEYDSLFETIPGFNQDELMLPVEGQVLDESGLGYINIITFSDDYNLLAQLWNRHIQSLIDAEVPALIIDLRANGGGSPGLAQNFAGYFFNEEITLYQRLYFNQSLGEFEATGRPSRIKPAPILYEGPIAVLISPNCISACEGFAYALSQEGRATIIGHYPTAGAFGEVGRGQYKLPDDLSMQFPIGRPETLDGELLIEGFGIMPDIIVPVTKESALGQVDAVLDAAIQGLLEQIK